MCHSLPMLMHSLECLYTTIFHWGLNIATNSWVVVFLLTCASFKISQIQLPSRGPSAHVLGQVSLT